VRRAGRSATAPDDYEVVQAPLYAALDALAARSVRRPRPAPGSVSTRAWRRCSPTPAGRWRAARSPARFPLGVGAVNALGLGPVPPDLSGRPCASGLDAMREVVARWESRRAT
jgi:hypothetical protein